MKKLLAVLVLCVAVLPLNADIFDDVENGNQKAVADFLAAGGDPNIRQADGYQYPLIVWASVDWNFRTKPGKTAQYTYAPIVKMLIDTGADVNAQANTFVKETAILKAAMGRETQDRIEIVKLLLKAGADQTKSEYSHPIYWASQFNSPKILKLLIAAGGNVNDSRTNSQTPVMTAAFYGNTAIMEILAKNGADLYKGDPLGMVINSYLHKTDPATLSSIKTFIKLGVDVNVPDEQGMTPLMRVAKGGKEPSDMEKKVAGEDYLPAATPGSKELAEIAKIVWNAGAAKSINAVDEKGRTALIYASYYNNSDMVNSLLAANAKIDMASKDGQTALMEASQQGNTEIVKLLLAKKANPNIVTNVGNTALMFAAEANHTEIIKALLAAGAKVNTINKNGQTALMFASQSGNTDMVKTLLESGANVNAMNTYGGTALMTAADKGYAEVVKTLLSAGANVNAANKQGYTSLIVAAKNGHIDTVKILLTAKPDINAAEKTTGWNALIFASSMGYNDIVKTLIAAGANIEAQTKDKHNALMMASMLGKEDVVKTLIAAGANLNAKDEKGKSAMQWAKEQGHDNIVKILLAAGAKK